MADQVSLLPTNVDLIGLAKGVTPAGASEVRWLDAGNGAVAAEIYAYSFPGKGPPGVSYQPLAALMLAARPRADGGPAEVIAEAGPAGSSAQRLLLDEDGGADYLVSPGWVPLTLGSNWQPEGSGWDPPGYRILSNNSLQLRGSARTIASWARGTGSGTVAQLPDVAGGSLAQQKVYCGGRDTTGAAEVIFRLEYDFFGTGDLTITQVVPQGLSGSGSAMVNLNGVFLFL